MSEAKRSDGRRLEGDVAVITGATHGIGLAIAQQLAAEGAKVVMADVLDAVEQSAAAVRAASGGDVITYIGDLSKEENVQAMHAATRAAFGPANILINNAGGGVILGNATAQLRRAIEEMFSAMRPAKR